MNTVDEGAGTGREERMQLHKSWGAPVEGVAHCFRIFGRPTGGLREFVDVIGRPRDTRKFKRNVRSNSRRRFRVVVWSATHTGVVLTRKPGEKYRANRYGLDGILGTFKETFVCVLFLQPSRVNG